MKQKAIELYEKSKQWKKEQEELIDQIPYNLLIPTPPGEHLHTPGSLKFFQIGDIKNIHSFCISSEKYLEARKKDPEADTLMFVLALVIDEGMGVFEAIEAVYKEVVLGQSYPTPVFDESLQ